MEARIEQFTGSLRRERLLDEIALEPLPYEGVSTMLHLLCPGMEVTEDVQGFFYDKTEGNPFYVEELLRFLSVKKASGVIHGGIHTSPEPQVVQGGLRRIEIPSSPEEKMEVPKSIHSLIQRRISHITPEMKELLSCGALLGTVFEFDVLQRVSNKPKKEVLKTIEAGMKAHIVRDSFEGGEERYRFVHAMIADALYAEIGKMRRRLWHGKAGDVLVEISKGRYEKLNGRLAYHFERGEEWEKALNFALMAARQAKDDYANQEAIKLFIKARELLPHLQGGQTFLSVDDAEITVAEGLGDVYSNTGVYEKALKEYRSMEEIARKKENEKAEGDALSKKSSIYLITGNSDDAQINAEKSLEIRERMGDRKGLAESMDSIGIVHGFRGDYEEALKYVHDALAIQKEIGDKSDMAMSMERIGTVYWNLGDFKKALKHLEDSLKIRREIKDKIGVSGSLNNIGNVYWSRGDYGEALRYHEESLKIRRQIGNKRGVAGSYTNIGNVHWGRGEYGKALKCHEESLKIDREIGYRRGKLACLINIGNILWARGDYKKALKCHEDALEISRELGDKKNIAMSLVNSGDVHEQTGNYGKALKFYEESLEINQEIGEKSSEAYCLLGKGNIHQALYDLEKSMEFYKDSLSMTEKMGMKTENAVVLTRIGNNYHISGNYKDALKYLKKAKEIVNQFGINEALPGVLEALSKVYLEKGKTDNASEYCEKLLEMSEKEELKGYIARGRKIRGEILLFKANPKFQAPKNKQIRNSKFKIPNKQVKAKLLKDSESELKEALKIAEEIGASPLLWQVHASLGKVYQEAGAEKKAKVQFLKAKEIIDEIASKIVDEKLKETFLNSKQVRSVIEI
jgi:tetratricopeptide (TPR) repeat protein